MALPDAAPARTLQHRRSIDIEVFARGDGLWEVDARLVDVKTREARLARSVRPAGEPIHDLLLRLVIDERFNIVEAGSDTRAMPYPGECDVFGGAAADAYGRLVGLFDALAVEEGGRRYVPGPLSQQRIAERVGASKAMVNRLLQDLERGGYIEATRERITLLKRLPPKW